MAGSEACQRLYHCQQYSEATAMQLLVLMLMLVNHLGVWGEWHRMGIDQTVSKIHAGGSSNGRIHR